MSLRQSTIGAVALPGENQAQVQVRANDMAPVSLRPVRLWLWAVAFCIFSMVIVGGATRLTQSGLSITEWKPVIGVIPPLTPEAWQAEFDRYKAIPQYAQLFPDMDVEGFKSIFYWEWAHRLLGRFIGVLFAVPLVAFWISGRLTPRVEAEADRAAGLGRIAGRDRLVDGEVGAQRPGGCVPIQAGDPSRDRIDHLRLGDLARRRAAALGCDRRDVGSAPPAPDRRRSWCWRSSCSWRSARWWPDCTPASPTTRGR